MYKNKTYGLYKYGYVEDLEKINGINLYESYLKLINTAKIDIFVSGKIEQEKALKSVKEDANISKLQDRIDIHVIESNNKKDNKEEKAVEEKLNITQGKLVIGTDVDFNEDDAKYKISLYNVILRRGCKIKIIPKCKRKRKFSIYSKIKLCKTKRKHIYKVWNRNRKL